MGHANFSRTDRIASLLRRELGSLVHEAVRNGLLPSVSVSDVEVTRDLAHANVFLTALVREQGLAAVKDLNANSWEFRRELAHRVSMRTVPELHFRYDESVDRGERIDALLRAPVVPVFASKPAAKKALSKTKPVSKATTGATKAPAKKAASKVATKSAPAKKAAAKKAPAKKAASKRVRAAD